MCIITVLVNNRQKAKAECILNLQMFIIIVIAQVFKRDDLAKFSKGLRLLTTLNYSCLFS